MFEEWESFDLLKTRTELEEFEGHFLHYVDEYFPEHGLANFRKRFLAQQA